MRQSERRVYLIERLLAEQRQYKNVPIPKTEAEQKKLFRALCNVRPPEPIDAEFLRVQDEYLQQDVAERGITDYADLTPVQKDVYLRQGDITLLKCDAIVNAANSALLGCFYPCHGCIDNAIHSSAGVQLRLACAELMRRQGHEEETGQAKLTSAFNLPSRYVLHTVGPIISYTGEPTEKDCTLLASCYRSCLELAEAHALTSIAFCGISTGEFHFPNDEAARIAVRTVQDYKRQTGSGMAVTFNVFTEKDYRIYKSILCLT